MLIKNSLFFDKEYVSFLNIGEKTGDMTLSFFNLNEIYYERVNEKIKTILKIMEPLSVIIIGLIIGLFLLITVAIIMVKVLNQIKEIDEKNNGNFTDTSAARVTIGCTTSIIFFIASMCCIF